MSEYAISTLFGSPAPDFMYISASAPDAPPLSDTTIGCFIRLFFWIAACIIRAIWSEAPPAPAATTISTGLVGSQARAGEMAGALASTAASAAVARINLDMRFFPVTFYAGLESLIFFVARIVRGIGRDFKHAAGMHFMTFEGDQRRQARRPRACPTRLLALPVRLALVEEGIHALAEI